MQQLTRQPIPYVRAIGAGPTVLCLHSSASSSKQFKSLADLLAPSFRVMAVDLYGYGKSPEWTERRPLTLLDEVSLLDPIFASERGPIHLVGHSYGGAVALKAATIHTGRVASLTVYEPVMFSLLTEEQNGNALDEITGLRNDVRHYVRSGYVTQAGRRFVDYWAGSGTWTNMPDWQREVIAGRMPKMVHDFEAVMGEATPRSRYRELYIPSKLMYGSESPSPTRRITELLAATITDNRVCEISGAGHMGPMTHAEQVNNTIERFLSRHARRRLGEQSIRAESNSGLYSIP